MDAKTVEGLGGKVDRYEYEFEASASAEIEDGFWRRAGGRVVIGGSINPNGDVEAQMRAFEELAKARWDETRGPAMTSLLAARQKAPSAPQEPPVAPETPEQDTEPAVPFGPPQEPSEGVETTRIVEFTLERRTDGKVQLDLYPELGGKVGQYPEVKYVAETVAMWDMLTPVQGNIQFKTPMKLVVNWVASWKYGRPTGKTKKDGTPGYYKDLISLRTA